MWFVKRLIPKEDENMIVAAIKKAELNTSGEIRVHIESECKEGNPLARAIYVFNMLGMYKTAARNGVLIYVAKKATSLQSLGMMELTESSRIIIGITYAQQCLKISLKGSMPVEYAMQF